MVEKVLFARELLAKLLARRQQTGSRFGCTPEVVTPTKYASSKEAGSISKPPHGDPSHESFARAPVKSETGASGFCEREASTE